MAIRTTVHILEDGNGFYGSCKEFPGIVVGELTEKECLKQTREAVKQHLEVLIAKGLDIPEESIVSSHKEMQSRQLNSIEDIPVTSLSG